MDWARAALDLLDGRAAQDLARPLWISEHLAHLRPLVKKIQPAVQGA